MHAYTETLTFVATLQIASPALRRLRIGDLFGKKKFRDFEPFLGKRTAEELRTKKLTC